MSMWESQQVFEILLTFSDRTKESKRKTGGGYDRSDLRSPFSSILYRGDFAAYVRAICKEMGFRLNAKILEKLEHVISGELIFQELRESGYYWAKFYRWKKDEPMKTVSISSVNKDFGADAFTMSPDMINSKARRFVEEVFSKESSSTNDCFEGIFDSFTVELSFAEREELRKKELAAAFVKHYSSQFCKERDLVFQGKRFVIAEYDYPKDKKSKGYCVAEKLKALGAKETKDISSSTDYLIVSTEKIQSADRYYLATDENGNQSLVLGSLGKPKIEKAIDLKNEHGKIKIIAIEHLEQLLK